MTPECRCHALAALECEEYRVEMAEEGGECGCGEDHRAQLQVLCEQDRQQALEHVAGQGKGGGLLAAEPCNIGRTRVARACRARIGEAHQPANNDGGGDRAEQVAAKDDQDIGFHVGHWNLSRRAGQAVVCIDCRLRAGQDAGKALY